MTSAEAASGRPDLERWPFRGHPVAGAIPRPLKPLTRSLRLHVRGACGRAGRRCERSWRGAPSSSWPPWATGQVCAHPRRPGRRTTKAVRAGRPSTGGLPVRATPPTGWATTAADGLGHPLLLTDCATSSDGTSPMARPARDHLATRGPATGRRPPTDLPPADRPPGDGHQRAGHYAMATNGPATTRRPQRWVEGSAGARAGRT